jgi:hypothetical protein
MLRMPAVWMTASLAILAAASAATAVDGSLTVRETAGVARSDEPVTTGVPFAAGAVKDLAALRLFDAAGKAIPADLHVLSPWPDGSVRTALLTFLADVPAGGSAEFKLKDAGGQPVPAATVKVADGTDAVTLDTGVLQLAVSRKRSSLIESLSIDGKPVLAAGGPGAIVTLPDGKQVNLADTPPTSVTLEHAGGVAATVVVKGRVGNLLNRLLGYTARLTVYAGRRIVRLKFWLENDGAFGFKFGAGNFNDQTAEWFYMDALLLRIPLAGDAAASVKVGKHAVELAKGDALAVEQRCEAGRWKNFRYTIRQGDRELESGDRIDGLLQVAAKGGPRLNLGVRHFWQNYEKALTVKDGVLDVHLWPTFGDWPRSAGTPGLMPPKGREVGDRRPGLYAFVGATHKCHELLLDFGSDELKATAATLDRPLMALASGEYYASTGAWGNFAPDEFLPKDPKLADAVKRWRLWARNVVDPKAPLNLPAARQDNRFGPGYGWMDFGDLSWVDGVCDLHYDWNWIVTLDYILTGVPEFLDAAVEMSRFRMDVAQVWSDRDAENFDYLVRYEKGCNDLRYPFYTTDEGTPQPQHNWIRGLILYYWLTGDEKAREAAVINASRGIYERIVRWFQQNPGPRGEPRQSGWNVMNLCAAYDLTAEPKYLDWAKVLWNNNLKLTWAEVLAGRMKLVPLQWYYSTDGLVNLHQRTGDPAILQQMKDFCHLAQDPKNWQYSSDMCMFMTNYAGYLAACGVDDYLPDATKWLDMGVPRDPRRLVLYTGTGSYTKEVGKPLRNGHILLWSLWQRSRGKDAGTP